MKTINSGKKDKKLLALAILLGLSWFPMVYLAKFASYLYTFNSEDWWLNLSPWRLIVGILLYLVIIPLLLKKYYGGSYLEITGLTLSKTTKQFLAGILLIVAALGVAVYASLPLNQLLIDYSSPLSALANIQPAFIEEVMMRGIFVYMLLKAGYKYWFIIVLGTLLFTSWHVASFGLLQGLLTGFISIPIMFLPRIMTNGVYVPAVLHAFTNSKIISLYSIIVLLLIEIAYFLGVKRKTEKQSTT